MEQKYPQGLELEKKKIKNKREGVFVLQVPERGLHPNKTYNNARFYLGGEYNSREGGHEINIGRDRRNHHGRGAAGQPVRINFAGKLAENNHILLLMHRY